MADFVTNTSNSGDGDWFPGDEIVAEALGAQRQPSTEFDPPTAETEETVTNWTPELEAVYLRNVLEVAIIAAMANNIQSPTVSGDAPLAVD